MSWRIDQNGREIVAAFDAGIDIEDCIAGTDAIAAADPDREASHVIIDFSASSSLELSVDELHRLALHIRLTYQRGPTFRFAFVVSSSGVERMIGNFVEVRDLLTARQAETLPVVGIFESVEAAREWATASS